MTKVQEWWIELPGHSQRTALEPYQNYKDSAKVSEPCYKAMKGVGLKNVEHCGRGVPQKRELLPGGCSRNVS